MLLYSINKAEGKIETNLYADFIIHGFECSHNGQVIEEEVCEENMDTLIGAPVLVKYYNEGDKGKDHLGTHEVYITKNRDTGSDMMATDTFAIGTFQSAEIKDMNVNGENKRCLVGHAQLWVERYYNVCSLLNEWLNKGIQIYCSCEYTFKNYEMKDNIQYIKSPYSYTGHTILNSEEKDGYGVVLPAYDEAAMVCWNSALQKDEEEISKKSEGNQVENAFIKALNGLSMGEVRDGIYMALANTMTAAEYNRMYISDYSINDDYFLYETYNEEVGEWQTYKVNYSKTDDGVTVDYENRVKMERKVEYVEVETARAQLETAVNEAKTELETQITQLNEQIASKDEELEGLKADNLTQKETVVSLNEQITTLNETITGLSDYKEKYEQEKYDQALNAAKDSYKEKFEKLNAIEKFESDEVQTLITETLDEEKSLNAKLQLADMLLDMSMEQAKPSQTSMNTKGQQIVEPGSSMNSIGNKAQKVIRDIDTYVISE